MSDKTEDTTDEEFFIFPSESSSDDLTVKPAQIHLPVGAVVQEKRIESSAEVLVLRSENNNDEEGFECTESDTDPKEPEIQNENSVDADATSPTGSTLTYAPEEDADDDDENDVDEKEDNDGTGYVEDGEDNEDNEDVEVVETNPINIDYESDFMQKESPGQYKLGGYHPVSVGDVFKDRYYAIHKLGWGHFSVVWMCFDTVLERYCAVKMVKSADHFSETARDEIDILNFIADSHWHPLRDRFVQLIDHFSVSGTHGTHVCLVFEILGDTLLKLIQRSRYQGLPIRNVKQIALQVLEGLYYIHKHCSIIHTDIKPENVLMVGNDLASRAQATRVVTAFFRENCHLIKPRNASAGKAASRRSVSFLFPENSASGGTTRPPANAENKGSRRCTTAKSSNKSTTKSSPKNTPKTSVPVATKLTKTAKRKLRARVKRNISFFLEHRQWLRQQAIEDLMALAQNNYLTPTLAAQAVTGKLPFMPPIEGIVFLNDKDLEQVEQLEQMESSDSGRQSPLFNLDQPQYIGKKLPKDLYSEAVRMLFNNPLEFICHVRRKTRELDRLERERHKLGKVVVTPRGRKVKQQGSSSCSAIPKMMKTVNEGESGIMTKRHSCLPNMDIIARQDPAVEFCPLTVKIADMGNACWFNHQFTDDIQTREYRAPEVILGAGYNEKADLWSAACLFWELATGDYLFNPQERRGRSTLDETHIASIIEMCGPIPGELVIPGSPAHNFIRSNGTLRNIVNLQAKSLSSVLMNRYHWSDSDALDFESFLSPMLETNPRHRCSALSATMHTWLMEDAEKEEEDDEEEAAAAAEAYGKEGMEERQDHWSAYQHNETKRPSTPDPRASNGEN